MRRNTRPTPRLDSSEVLLLLWCLALGLSATVLAMPLIAQVIDRRSPAHGPALMLEYALLAPFWLAVFIQDQTGIAFILTLFVLGAAGGLLLGLFLVWLLRLPER
jgi:hypothetical protein